MNRRELIVGASLLPFPARATTLSKQENRMRKLTVFNNVSLDGYFTDAHGDMSWAHKQDAEWMAFTSENAGGDAELVFGRVTYEMMASFWPTQQALQMMPTVAEAMNRMRKTVFTSTLDTATWQNTRLFKDDLIGNVRRMKAEPGPDLLLMGSGQLISQLTQSGLIDEYQIVITTSILGAGRSMFEGVSGKPSLKLTKTRAFQNGNVVLWYSA